MLLLLVSAIPAMFWIVGTDPVDEELACSRTGLGGRENSRVDRGKRKVRIHTKVGTIVVLENVGESFIRKSLRHRVKQ